MTVPFTSRYAQPVDYGADTPVLPDLDETLQLGSTRTILADSFARMLLLPKGSLEFHPDDGVDLRSYLNDEVTDDSLARMQVAARDQLERDPRAVEARVAVRYDWQKEEITLRADIDLGDEGPFAFILSVDKLTETLTVVE